MANTVQYITYYIVLTDPDQVKALQDQFPYGYQFAPYNPGPPAGGAAVAFSAPWAGSQPGTSLTDYHGPAPYTWSPSWTASNDYDQSVATFERHSGGFWGIGGDTVRFYWVGQFTLAAPAVPTVNKIPPPMPENLRARRFLEGFETNGIGAWQDGDHDGCNISRSASRHVGGMGLALRGLQSTSGVVQLDVYTPSGFVAKTNSWERFYVRLRKPDPGLTVAFWHTVGGTVSSANGVELAVTPAGQIAISNTTSGLKTLLGTTAILPAWDGTAAMDAWHRIDVVLQFNTGASDGHVALYLDGVLAVNVPVLAAGIGSSGETHKQSTFASAAVANVMSMDVDDWMNCDVPIAYTGKDWLSGSKIVMARPTGFGTNHNATAWPGAIQVLLQNGPQGLNGSPAFLASTTAASVLEVNLDVDKVAKGAPGALGVASILLNALAAATTHACSLGSSLIADTSLTTPGTLGPMGLMAYSGGAAFMDVTNMTARFIKGTGTDQAKIATLMAQVELTGIFGTCDFRLTEVTGTPPTFPRDAGQHNAPYPLSDYAANPLSSLTAPVIIQGGTYVGNNTGQDLTFRAPVHLFFVRPLASGTGGFQWWSTLQASHKQMQRQVTPSIANCDEDPTFTPGVGETQQKRYRVRIAGSDAQVNATGVTYQYIAFMDPGARFCLCGPWSERSAIGPITEPLIDADFTPEFAFLQGEDGSGSTGQALLIKGPGNNTDEIAYYHTLASISTALTFAAGALLGNTNLFVTANAAAHNIPYAAFRRHDGNNDPGEPGVLALISWIGDGTASRTIGIVPASGKRPMFCMIAASDSGVGVWRDPSHTGSNSTNSSGTDITTGITAGGIDQVSVGSSMNVNGVRYNGIVFFADATAGNNGWGTNVENIPVQADRHVTSQWPPTPDPSVFNPIVPPPAPLVGEPDLEDFTVLSDDLTEIGGLVGGQTCEFYTRKCVNMALSRIGISRRIVDLAADTTQDAIIARSHVLEDVNAVLRDFDWPFATRYASLVLAGGTVDTPVNEDWQYAYRAPNAMMKARRLVGQGGQKRNYDPKPPQFRLGSDATGPVIYTDAVSTTDAPVILEYTIRNLCPAFYGDALFRNALAWKFGESLAMPLARDAKMQDYCASRYRDAIARAKVPAAEETQQAPQGDASWITDRN